MSESNEYVFICYAREDLEMAERIHRHLNQSGISTWLDKFHLLSGQRWKSEVKKAIRDCEYFLALLSSSSVSKRGYVQKELREALDLLDEFPESERFIIPVRLDDCHPSHEKLNDLHWVDLFPSYNDRFKDLLGAIRPELFNSVDIESVAGEPKVVSIDQDITVRFTIVSKFRHPQDVWLGASLVDKHGREIFDTSQDATVRLESGTHEYTRTLTVPRHITSGPFWLYGAIYLVMSGRPRKEIRLHRVESRDIITVR